MIHVPHNISDLSITFFARGRPIEVQKSHANFDAVRATLLGWPADGREQADLDALIALADPKEELRQASGGQLEFRGHEIFYGDMALHNLWVDKILAFRDAGENYDPIFLALQDLQKNPTPAARDRLPIFVERSKLGFLPDGRIAAFKGVRANFNDVHSNTVHYGIGKTVSIPRHACNADPNQTCVAGLHLGAIDYIKEMGYGWGADRRMLLCAFWPRHVVAVPTDYRGGKMRVEELTVLDEVDRKYVDEILNNGQLIVRGYDLPADAGVEEESKSDDVEGSGDEDTAGKADPDSPAGLAKPGDWVEIDNDEDVSDGIYLVVSVDDNNGDAKRVTVKTGSRADDIEAVDDDAVISIAEKPPVWMQAKVGDYVEKVDSSDKLRVVEVAASENYPGGERLRLQGYDEDDWTSNDDIDFIVDAKPVVWLRIEESDTVRIEGHAILRDGEYEIASRDQYASADADGLMYEVAAGDNDFSIRNDLIKSIKREEEEAQKAGADAAAASAAGAIPAPAQEVTVPFDASRPIAEQAEVGDKLGIFVPGPLYRNYQNGTYEIVALDRDDQNQPVQIRAPGRNLWVWKQDIQSVIKTVPAGATTVVVDPVSAVLDTRPIWEQVLIGDLIRVANEGDVQDGLYKVLATDSALTGGRDRPGIRIKDKEYETYGSWIYNKGVVEIVERDGKPFGKPEAAAVAPEEPAWKRAKVGDTIKIVGSTRYGQPDGEYKVDRVDERNGGDRRLRVANEGGLKWVENHNVDSIVTPVATASDESVWKQAVVGTKVLIEGSSWISPGEHTVLELHPHQGLDSEKYAFRVQPGGYWIEKAAIKAIVAVEPWAEAKRGDTVRIEGSRWVINGEYEVQNVLTGRDDPAANYALTAGGYSIEKRAIKAVVRKA